MSVTYHIKIKKDYAADLIKDLKKMDAIELIIKEDDLEVPRWQMDEVERRIKKYENKPESMIEESLVFKILDSE